MDTRNIFLEIWECKCGNTEEISVSVDIEWYICRECKRRGQWRRQQSVKKQLLMEANATV